MSEQSPLTTTTPDAPPLPTVQSDPTAVTANAPPFREPTPRRIPTTDRFPGLPRVGQQIGDFELTTELGEGAFARVYLARQISLGRMVALKVSRNQSQEARTLAGLEHDHIVRVFSESIDPDKNLRLLCMQYVPGTTLERIINNLSRLPPEQRDGQAILDIVDALSTNPATLDLGALRDREALAKMDSIEAVCWFGARLAEALAHAHGLGILHRDIKPANVLVNRYGRPLLADFNVSTPGPNTEDGSSQLGGTLAYMAPEHIDAFNAEDFTSVDAVDVRSEVFSLGVLLYQFFTGELPYAPPGRQGSTSEILWAMSADRRNHPPQIQNLRPDVPSCVARVLARCLAPRPNDRFAGTAELAASLDSCRELRKLQRQLPRAHWLTRICLEFPFNMGAILILLPHLLGSIVNISYNGLRIVETLNPLQKIAFWQMVTFYNLLVYPLCLVQLCKLVTPVVRTWQQMISPAKIEATKVDEVRRQVLAFPRWGILLACLGWLPGGILFPLYIHYSAGALASQVWGHFIFSFTISGLIALTYSVLSIEFLVLRVFYPGLWSDGRKLHEFAPTELKNTEDRLAILQFLAVLIPLAGAALMVGVGPRDFSEENYRVFRLLVTALMALGMCGLGLALVTANDLRKTLTVLTTGARR